MPAVQETRSPVLRRVIHLCMRVMMREVCKHFHSVVGSLLLGVGIGSRKNL
jgi:hypothetical protein